MFEPHSLALAAALFVPKPGNCEFHHFGISQQDWDIVKENICDDIRNIEPDITDSRYKMKVGM